VLAEGAGAPGGRPSLRGAWHERSKGAGEEAGGFDRVVRREERSLPGWDRRVLRRDRMVPSLRPTGPRLNRAGRALTPDIPVHVRWRPDEAPWLGSVAPPLILSEDS
jgi:hypothetical protein